MDGLISLFIEIIKAVLTATTTIITYVYPGLIHDTFINNSFNIYLFSDKGWFTEPIMLMDIFAFIVILLMFIFLIRILYKATKKFINMIFGVFKL